MNTSRRIHSNIVMTQCGEASRKSPKHKNLAPNTEQRTEFHAADAFYSIDDINAVVTSALNSNSYHKAAMFIVGINTGYRCGDLVSLRVSDVTDDDGNIRSVIYIKEQKTNKSRPVYFNEASKKALRFIIDNKGLKGDNFIFRGDGNRKSYLDRFEYDDESNVVDAVVTSEKYRPDGTERETAPMLVNSVGRWLKTVTKNLGIDVHYSSHATRKTFTEFFSRDWIDNRNLKAASQVLNWTAVNKVDRKSEKRIKSCNQNQQAEGNYRQNEDVQSYKNEYIEKLINEVHLYCDRFCGQFPPALGI